MNPGKKISGLYAVTPETADTDALAAKVSAALRGGARIVQYRSKSDDLALRRRQAGDLARLCRSRGAVFIVNDSIELALQVQADGVHLGRDDDGVDKARALLGPGRIIGVSCYDEIGRAHAAKRQGADYVAFGSFFASPTKPAAVRAQPQLLGMAAKQAGLPVVAIGGIDLGNAFGLIAAGADALAVVSALFDAADTQAQARRFVRLFESFSLTGKQA
ncbi:MAG TPA: thiamine phosphate synthase [Burkholderiales bacterium]|nr:thiamine phosphate synthase [Burkholderiales bacterium]